MGILVTYGYDVLYQKIVYQLAGGKRPIRGEKSGPEKQLILFVWPYDNHLCFVYIIDDIHVVLYIIYIYMYVNMYTVSVDHTFNQ
jgi:hypothetical protein